MKPLVIALDFDGVLTKGGEELKQKAWDILSLPWDDSFAVVLGTFRDNFSDGRGSRFDILRQTFMNVLVANGQWEFVGFLVEGYAACYNVIVQELLMASGMPEGTEETLEKLKAICPLYVNSATPKTAVQESMRRFGISRYFSGLYGQPTSKVENLRRIIGNDPTGLVFVGDGRGDWKVAKEFGCKFIGIANAHNKWDKEPNIPDAFPVVSSIRDVPAVIREL